MQSISIVRESNILRSPRVMQLEGLFDIPINKRSIEKWEVALPINEKPWNIGLIVGPSGCGKSTVLGELFKEYLVEDFKWNKEAAIIDDFPSEMGVKKIVELLSSVGFSSPPYWVRPYHVLSTGQKFRVHLARALSENKEIIAIDEFTSVVDRTVAKIGSSAIARTVRDEGRKLIVATCHNDIEDWLQPDWVYKPAENEFLWRLLRRRPDINLEIIKVNYKAWEFFKKHHYLSADINRAASCFVALWGGVPVGFYSYLHFVNNRLKKTKRGHRGVCLPDYQGVGIGVALQDYIGACLSGIGFDFIIRTAHPAMIGHCKKSEKWATISGPVISYNHGRKGKHAVPRFGMVGRMSTAFRYCGPCEDKEKASELINQEERKHA